MWLKWDHGISKIHCFEYLNNHQCGESIYNRKTDHLTKCSSFSSSSNNNGLGWAWSQIWIHLFLMLMCSVFHCKPNDRVAKSRSPL